MIEIVKICVLEVFNFVKKFKFLKIREIFCENPRIIFVLFYDVHKENMFTINLEDGREAPSKTSIYKFGFSVCLFVWMSVCLYPINVKTA